MSIYIRISTLSLLPLDASYLQQILQDFMHSGFPLIGNMSLCMYASMSTYEIPSLFLMS